MLLKAVGGTRRGAARGADHVARQLREHVKAALERRVWKVALAKPRAVPRGGRGQCLRESHVRREATRGERNRNIVELPCMRNPLVDQHEARRVLAEQLLK